MKRHPSLTSAAAVIASVCLVSFLLFYDFGKSSSRIIQSLTSYGHVPLFGFIALGILWLLSTGRFRNWERRNYIRAAVLTLLVGIATEIVQTWTPSRNFRLTDILADLVGAVSFLSLLYSFQKGIQRKTAVLLRSLSLLALVVMAHSVITATLDTARMENDAPLLGSFETFLELSRWKNTESTITRTNLHATDGERALEVNLNPGVFPGVSLVHMISDWRNYTTLSFDVFLTGSSPLAMTVRINDEKHNEEFDDRFNKSYLLKPGPNHIAIDLKDVAASPQGRRMDMARVRTLCMFSYHLNEPRQIVIDYFRLE
jgi:VanZ family protein